MAIDDVFDGAEEEEIYGFKRVGSFGRFSTIDNFPIEFFLTTLRSSQLDDLTFARDIKPSSIDFEQLLQRDIDEERVKTEIEPYLTSVGLTDVEKKSKTIFFPPLLVAAMPVEKKTMKEHYANQCVTGDKNFLYREWDEHFKLKLKKVKAGYKINPSILSEERVAIIKEPAVFEANLSDGIENGISLVVIDGQHRLKALIDVYKENKIDLSELAVPICILFSPNSTKEVAEKLNNDVFNIPTTSQIFRQLFVDVNKNAVQVGGHFNILLSEGNMGSAICRGFCKRILETGKLKALAQVEWNQKNKKLSTEISKKYYLTSVGVIEKGLTETFSRSKVIFNYLIDFSSIENIVHPNDNDDYHDYPKVSWDRFTFSQKKAIEKQLDVTLIPLLERLFFESKLFKPASDCFIESLNKLEKLAKEDPKGQTQYQPVLDKLVEYIPIGDENTMRVANANLRKFEEDVSLCKENDSFDLSGYAIFQRAIFLTLSEILKACRVSQIDSKTATDLFISFIDNISINVKDLISDKRSYCQSFIFNLNKVNPTADVRKGLAFLLLSNFSNLKFTQSVLSESFNMNDLDRFQRALLEEMQNLGYRSLNSYFDLYEKSKLRHFKATYATDRSIGAEDRQELSQQELIRKRDEKAYKDGEIAKNDISGEFENLVKKYVNIETENSKIELQKLLGSELDIFGLSGLFSNEESIVNDLEE
ncbi:hypothetical protein [Vibrio atlanticus]|uniref:hypothetical protein n=1 Tax=Vibrio atlanticus TaxID=693153 RepID=UPI003CF64D1F